MLIVVLVRRVAHLDLLTGELLLVDNSPVGLELPPHCVGMELQDAILVEILGADGAYIFATAHNDIDQEVDEMPEVGMIVEYPNDGGIANEVIVVKPNTVDCLLDQLPLVMVLDGCQGTIECLVDGVLRVVVRAALLDGLNNKRLDVVRANATAILLLYHVVIVCRVGHATKGDHR